jgi:nitroreductase/NAD-dependent dihydropyrimidine dehydrogenase PreA subunit
MSQEITTVIESELCTGCGLCVRVCPAATLSLRQGKAVVSGHRSLGCGHCAAVCPTGAIRVRALDENAARFETFATEEGWLPPGQFDAGMLMRLMRSRRSCRNYQARPVAGELLSDLIRAGIAAPSGTNSQKWTFTVLAGREEVVALGNRVGMFFERLNRLAANPLARFYSRLFGGDALGRYYRRHSRTTAEALRVWREEGRDRLFHGAPAAILVGSQPGASCPAEDALLATQNILLAAHAVGLGSCLIGYVVEAMKRDRTIQKTLGIPESEPVYAVIALGYPDERYLRIAGRKWPLVRILK